MMKKILSKSGKALIFVLLMNSRFYSQQSGLGNNHVAINKGDPPVEVIRKAAHVTPSKRQYEWQKLEMTGFIHFGINTFDEVEWGKKEIDISKFNPKEINVKQWVKAFKDAGIKLLILTAKHHDGFCLWPTKYTALNISRTPFQNGKGDIVGDLSKACRKAGLKFGVYLSPWDMHEKSFGTPAYNRYFMNQLTELLTNYGEISEVWFDGANGEGPNGKKQVYDWQSYYKLIRRLQPKAVIAVSGPDVRWVGTESGYGRQTEWSVLPGSSTNEEEVAANSQQKALDGAFTPRNLMDEDLGSRQKILKAHSLVWYPAEIDVSIRPGWFYNKNDDSMIKPPYKLADIYYNSVGLNGVLLLNVPPDKRGLITEGDVKSLQGMHYLIGQTFKNNLLEGAGIKASSQKKGFSAKNIIDRKPETYWTTDDTVSTASIEFELAAPQNFNCAMLQENIPEGQRIEKFSLEYRDGDKWVQFAKGTTVGYKRLVRFPEIKEDRIRLVIEQSRTNPTLSSFGLYKAPPEVSFMPEGVTFKDTASVKLLCDTKDAGIYYTTDGSQPDKSSRHYTGPIKLDRTAVITAVAISPEGVSGLPVKAGFNKAKYNIEYKAQYDSAYPGSGVYTLVDGALGTYNFKDGKWQGFHGTDAEAVIDLGKIKPIRKLSWRFLESTGSYIFLPGSVEYSISDNGKEFRTLKAIVNDETGRQDKIPFIKSFDAFPENIQARYIRIKAVNIGLCPPWHPGAGDKAWMFTDEVTVE
jgi:alpha-L-fucosidase